MHLKFVVFDEAQKGTRPGDVTPLTNVDEVCVRTNAQRFQT